MEQGFFNPLSIYIINHLIIYQSKIKYYFIVKIEILEIEIYLSISFNSQCFLIKYEKCFNYLSQLNLTFFLIVNIYYN